MQGGAAAIHGSGADRAEGWNDVSWGGAGHSRAGGMAIVGCFELDRGEMLSVTLEPGTATQVTVECELIRCQHLAGIYRDFGVRLSGPREG